MRPIRDRLNPDLDDIFYHAQAKSGKSMFDFMVYLESLPRDRQVDILHASEQKIIRNEEKRLGIT